MRLMMFSLLLFVGSLAASAQTPAPDFSASVKGFSKTDKGVLYKNHTNGKGQKPVDGDVVTFHAYIRHADTVLQTTRQGGRPLSQPCASPAQNKVFEGLNLGAIGDSITVAIPIDEMPNGAQKPFVKGEYLFVDYIILGIKTKADLEKVQSGEKTLHAALDTRLAAYKAGKLETKTTASGLKYIIHEAGTGKPTNNGKPVSVHYIGVLPDGTEFDNSIKRGEPIEFPLGVGQVIKGWDEGVALLKEGGKATLFIPYQLAYGEEGRPPQIPAKSELVFYIELVAAQ